MEKHPLLIENVIQSVMQYLDYQTVKPLRLVHPAWNNAIVTPNYISKTVLKINLKDKNLQEFFKFYPNKNESYSEVQIPKSISLSHFGSVRNPQELIQWFKSYNTDITDLYINKNDVGIRKNIICSQPCCGGINLNTKSKIFVNLLSGLLPNLEVLRIPVFDFISLPQHFQDMGMKLTLPKLKTLEIATAKSHLPKDVDSESWNFILNSAINLKTLKLRLQPVDPNNVFVKEREHLFYGIQPNYLVKLTTLDLSDLPMEFTQLRLLARIKFANLKSLSFNSVHLRNNMINPSWYLAQREYKIVLHNVKHSLEYLDAATFIAFLNDISLPDEMVNLKELVHTLNYRPMDNISVLKRFPNLDSLTLNQNVCTTIKLVSDLFPSFMGLTKHSLRKLQLNDIPLQLEAFKRLVSSFPDLESLSILSKQPETLLGEDLIWDLDEFLVELKGLSKLTELNITIFCGNRIQDGASFIEAISQNLPKLLALQKCTIICKHGSILLGDVKKLRFPPQLKNLEFQNFQYLTADDVCGAYVQPKSTAQKCLKFTSFKNVKSSTFEQFRCHYQPQKNNYRK